MSSRVAVIAFLVALVGCGPSIEDRVKAAQSALDAKDFSGAQAAAEEALKDPAVAKDAKNAWKLELIRLHALAAASNATDLASALEKNTGAQVTAPLYRELADKLREAGNTGGAIDVLAAGDKRFPADHQTFQDAIDAIKNAGVDPAELEKLKALGYL